MDELLCDLCGEEITDFESLLEHYTGIINGKKSGHIHVCTDCSLRFSLHKYHVDFDRMKEAMKEVCYDHILGLPDQCIQVLVNEIGNDKLLIFLKHAPETVKILFLKNVSERRSEMLREDLELMGPMTVVELRMVQKEVVTFAKRLDVEGNL